MRNNRNWGNCSRRMRVRLRGQCTGYHKTKRQSSRGARTKARQCYQSQKSQQARTLSLKLSHVRRSCSALACESGSPLTSRTWSVPFAMARGSDRSMTTAEPLSLDDNAVAVAVAVADRLSVPLLRPSLSTPNTRARLFCARNSGRGASVVFFPASQTLVPITPQILPRLRAWQRCVALPGAAALSQCQSCKAPFVCREQRM